MTNQHKELWESTLTELEKSIPYITYETWIKPLEPIDIADGRLVLRASTVMFSQTINERYMDKIKSAMKKANVNIYDVEIFVGDSAEEYYKTKVNTDLDFEETQFNPAYTFSSFVEASSNKFACAAAKAVAAAPGIAYNPLVIYGGTGLGKTHLLQAIGNFISSNSPSLKIVYTTGEIFTNELIESIHSGRGKGELFRAKHRNIDVLIVDDIQFIANKPSTQEEFFNTFNYLCNRGKQIVISSDRPISELAFLEDRLKTRFESGLVGDVQPPDIEAKIAILKKKAEQQKQVIDISVLSCIAESANDIRTLEGRLKKVIFASILEDAPITVEFVKETLQFANETTRETLTAEHIISEVCKYYNVNKQDLIGKRKNKEVVEPRQICVYLITELLSLPLTVIGQTMGGRDHTTMMHARDKIGDLIKINDKIAREVNDIKNIILQN